MKDGFNREITYLRISLTDRCNYRCEYCMPESGVEDIGHDRILKIEEIEKIVQASAGLGIKKIRLTGGEPLVRKGIVDLIRKLSAIEGIEEITMTTNGALLAEKAKELKAAGLSRVNISIDSLRAEKFRKITRGGDLDDVFCGINTAIDVGLTPIKLNVVAIKGFNDDEILDFVQLTLQHEYDVRFIELMPIGSVADSGCKYISAEEIKAKLPMLRTIAAQDGVAEMYKYPGARGRLGFINPISCGFCHSCNKIRLTADGKLKACLHSDSETDLRAALEAGDLGILTKTIEQAILGKEEKHYLNQGASPGL